MASIFQLTLMLFDLVQSVALSYFCLGSECSIYTSWSLVGGIF